MNIFQLASIAPGLAGADVFFGIGSQWGIVAGIIAAILGGVAGFFLGPIAGLIFLLPFEGLSRLIRFIRTGKWTEPNRAGHSNDPE